MDMGDILVLAVGFAVGYYGLRHFFVSGKAA